MKFSWMFLDTDLTQFQGSASPDGSGESRLLLKATHGSGLRRERHAVICGCEGVGSGADVVPAWAAGPEWW